MSTPASINLSASQAQGLLQAFTVVVQRLDELSTQPAFTTEMVGLSQPMATFQDIGQQLQDGLAQPLQSLVVTGSKTVAEVKSLIQTAVDAVGAIDITSISESLETLSDRQILWLDIALDSRSTLRDYTLNLGQSPSGDPSAPSLLDQGLVTGEIQADVEASLSGHLRIGVDLRPGLVLDQAIVLQIDDLQACAHASGVAEDVSVRYGILDLGELDAQVRLDSCLNIDLIEGALGRLSLGELGTMVIGNLFSLGRPSDGTADFSVDFDFDLEIGGFDQSGQTLTLGVQALDGFDLGTLELVLPEIHVDGLSTSFDFSQFTEISLEDLGNYLTGLAHWLPQWGQGLQLPVLGQSLGELFDLSAGIDSWIASLQDSHGNWSFEGIHGLIDRLASLAGLTDPAAIEATFQLNWNAPAQALEWTLPYQLALDDSFSFDAGQVVPSTLPLDLAASAQAQVQANLDFGLTGGVAITSSANTDPISSSTLLSELNSGLGLTSQGLLSGHDDIHFRLSDGSLVGVDLNGISTLGSAESAGTATVADLLAVLNAASPAKLSASLSAHSTLVLRDLTYTGLGTPAFAIEAPSVSVTLSTREDGSTLSTTSTSVAPLVLGLWGATGEVSGGQLLIESASLESVSPLDRLYLRAQDSSDPLVSATLTLSGQVEGGAAMGPLSLQIVDGQFAGGAQWQATLNDPGTGAAADGRVYLSELQDAGLAVLDASWTAPSLHGIFQLQVTPEAMNTALDIDLGDYSSDPLDLDASNPDGAPDTALVPYLELNLATGEGWDAELAPSEKLQQILSGGLREFSWQDLPNLLDALADALEDTPLWNWEIPKTSLSIGELLDLRTRFDGLSLPDLDSLLNASSSGSLNLAGWQLQWQADLSAALPDLQALDLSLAGLPGWSGLDLQGRFEQLSLDLDALMLAWDGRPGSDADFDADFLGRLGAWKSHLSLTLGDFEAALSLAFSATPPAELQALMLTMDGLFDFLDALPSDLSDFSVLIEGLFLEGESSYIPGLTVTVSTPSIALATGEPLPKVFFDINFSFDDGTFAYALDLDRLDVSGSPLQVEGSGRIDLVLDGSLQTRVGFDLATLTPLFTLDAHTQANLSMSIESSSDAVLSASLGGLVGLSVGRVDSSTSDPFVISLTASEGSSDPARLTYTGAEPSDGSAYASGDGTLGGSGYFSMHLPLYVNSVAGSAPVVTVDLEGSLDLTPPIEFSPSITVTGEVGDLFEVGDLGLSGWLNGAILFIDALTAVLESDLVEGLPFVQDIDLSDEGFLKNLRDVLVTLRDGAITTLGDVRSALDDALDGATPLLGGTVQFYIDGVAMTADQADMTMEQLFTPGNGVDSFVVDLGLTGLVQKVIDFGDLDLGLGALEISGTGGLDFAASVALNLGLGYSPAQGFFVQGSASGEHEMTVDLGLGLRDPSEIELALGPLKFALQDATPGNVVDNVNSRELSATLNLDLGSGVLSASAEDLLADMSVTGNVRALLDVELSAKVQTTDGSEVDLGLGMGLQTGFYQGEGDAIELSWSPGDGLDWGDPSQYLHFELPDVYVDFEKIFGPAIVEMAERLAQAFEPLEPVLDMLTDEVPLVSDLSKKLGEGAVTYLDAISWFGEGFDSASEFIHTLNTLVDINTELGKSGRFYLGSLGLGSGDSASAMSSSSRSSASLSKDSLSHTEDQGDQDDAVSGETKRGLLENDWNIAFPLLQNPDEELADFLFGGQADLITWNIPDLNAGFELRKSFPIFPPLFVELFGGVNFQTNFDLGYDTRGIRLAMDSRNALDLVKGVYLHDDHSDIAHASNAAELSLTATIGAGAKLDVAVAQAGVEGGLKGTLSADLADPDEDGKVYVDELVDQIAMGIECVFDLSGALDVFLEAYIKVGVDTPIGFVTLYKDRFKLAEATILDWSAHLCAPVVPVLAEASGGTLTLNMGSRASLVIPGETEDGDELFLIEYTDGKTVVSAYGHSEEFSGISKIVFDAGEGHDTVLIAPEVSATVEGRGGAGNDNLQGGSGVNKLWGDDGSDVLGGRGSNDSLVGGAGDDFVYGYGGNDTLDGGDGDDALHGEDDVGDMVAFKAANPDFQAGTAGDDAIDGGSGDDQIVAGDGKDTVRGGADDDAIDAGAGDDSVEGGDGNDQIRGGAGEDKLYGDNKDGSLGEGQGHADKIEGDGGYNQIWGGEGDDLLYAADEDQLAAAPGVTVGAYSSLIEGGNGADMIYGTTGKDRLSGGFGSDYIASGKGADFILGGPGGDALIAAGGSSTILGGHGNDVIDGGDGANWIEGGPGDDHIFARAGADTVYGGTTNDTVKGGYEYLQQDLSSGQAVIAAEHGGFRATPAADSCAPEIYFYPEVYAPTGPLTVKIFNDLDRDGIRDAGEADVLPSSQWQLTLRQAPDGVVVWQGAVTGAQQVVDLPDGIYEVALQSGAGNTYMPSGSASLSTFVEMVAGGVVRAPEMGWYSSSSIRGQVIATKSDNTSAPASAVVFIDADKDGSWDASEAHTLTAADGSYALTGLAAGSYTLGVTDDGLCALPTPRSATVSVDGMADKVQNFNLLMNTAPVVSGVQLYGGSMPRWWSVPDGNEQLNPIDPSGAVSKIAITLCSSIGVNDNTVSAVLVNLDSKASLPLRVAASSLNRVEFALNDGGLLQFGRYQLQVDDSTLQDSAKNNLDGEWKHPQGYDSGNGAAGGDFVFEFVLGTAAGGSAVSSFSASASAVSSVSSLPQGTVSVGTGTSTLQGVVWAHDARLATLARDSGEVGIAGQTIEVRDGSGALVTRVLTGLDADGNGQLSSDEAGVFRITDLRAGTYTVTQVPTASWLQEVSSAASPELMLTAAAASSGDSKLALVDGSGGTLKVARDWAVPGLRVRDVAFKDADEAYAIGKAADGSAKLVLLGLDASLSVKDLAPPPAGLKSNLVGLDRVGEQYLLAAAQDGTVLRYNLAGNSWTELGKLSELANLNTLYPVGDLAVVSPELAYAVVSNTASTDLPGDNKQQFLLQFDARTLQPISLKPLNTASPLVGLDLAGSGRLAGLDTQGRLYDIDPSTATASAAMAVAGQTAAAIGGLSLLRIGQAGKSSGAPVTVSTQDGKTTEIGFGDLPRAQTLPDGNDTIDGGCGPEADVLNGDDGLLPTGVRSEGGNDSLRGRDGNDTLIGGLQGDTLLGEAGNDSLVGGSSESNRMDGGTGKDTLLGGSAADFMAGGDDADSLTGAGGNDWMHGQGGDDTLLGQDGDDLLVGGAGNDLVTGGAGNDTLVVVNKALGGDYAASPEASGGGSYDGGADSDKLVVVMEGASGSVNLLLNNSQVKVGSLATESITAMESALLVGADGADELNAAGFSGSSVLYGLGGKDTLNSGGANDTLAGGSGQNSLSGAAMNDLYLIDAKSEGDFINEGSGGGADTVDASAATQAIQATLSSSGTVASGGAAFEFSSHVEQLILGSGDDTLSVAAGTASAMTVTGGGGSDTLGYTTWTTTSPVSVNLETGSASGLGRALAFENVTGGAGNDTLTGNAQANLLDGGAGNDSLTGAAGQDTLVGGAGSNTLDGGADNDLYLLLSKLLTDLARESAGAGTDTLNFSGLAGTDIVHTINTSDVLQVSVGSAGGALQAQSKAAIENLVGGAAGDRFVFGAAGSTPALLDGGGNGPTALNVLDYSAYTTPVSVALPAKPGFSGTATGTGGVKNIDKVIGGSAADVLSAGYAAATLEGGAGADLLTGSDQNDQLTGGAGDDTLLGGEGQDTAVFSGPRSSYSISWNPITQRLAVSSSAEGADALASVETLRFSDASYAASSFMPTPADKLGITVKTWNGRAVPGVALASGSATASTDASGQAQLPKPASALPLTAALSADATARSKVDLTDAIQVLKQIVGLTSLNSHQMLAADYTSDGRVDLSDAIGILKHIVGLSAPTPTWMFVDAASTPPSASAPLSLGVADVQLVGVLKGDVDGSWTA